MDGMSTREKVIIALALIAAVGAFGVAAVNTGTDTTDLSVSGNEAVEAITPRRNAEAIAQQDIVFDLAPGFDGRLVAIDDRVVPPEQVTTNSALGEIRFRPDPDGPIERLEGPQVCVLAEYWPVTDPEEVRPFTWCFEVV